MSNYSRSGEEPERIPPRWTPTETLDTGADVILAFHGLMCLCKHNNGFCEVGILNTDKGAHDLCVYVFEVDAGFDPPASVSLKEIERVYPVITTAETGDRFNDIVDIRVFRPRAGHDGVKFYVPPGEPLTDRNDFRFITDLEGPGFYEGRLVGKNHEAFGPRFHVSDGVFYTLCKTARTFQLNEGRMTNDTRSIARIVGANIYLDRTGRNPGTVELRIDKHEPITLPSAEGKKNLVLIDNSCPAGTCSVATGDFDRYFDAITPPEGRAEITLKRAGFGTGPAAGTCDSDFQDTLDSMLADCPVKKFHDPLAAGDDSPCGAAGAGSSGSLGPQG